MTSEILTTSRQDLKLDIWDGDAQVIVELPFIVSLEYFSGVIQVEELIDWTVIYAVSVM